MDIVLKTKKQLPFLHTRWYRSVDYVIMNNVGNSIVTIFSQKNKYRKLKSKLRQIVILDI